MKKLFFTLVLFLLLAFANSIFAKTTYHLAPPECLSSHFPRVSGDGKRVVFSCSTSFSPWVSEIYISDIYGTNLKRITNFNTFSFWPSISADGSKVVFSSQKDDPTSHIYITNSDGTGLRQLTFPPFANNIMPVLSGDSSTVIFYTNSTSPAVMNSDGTNLRIFSNIRMADIPSISHDGTNIVFAGYIDNDFTRTALLMITPSGIEEISIPFDGYIIQPQISGDASNIVFGFSSRTETDVINLFTINSNGTNLKQLTFGNVRDMWPAINFNGSKIAFERYPYLYITNSDGSNLQNLLVGGGGVPHSMDYNGNIITIGGSSIVIISSSQMINPTDGGTLKCRFRCKPSHEGIDVDKSLYQKPVKAPATGTIVKIDNVDDSNAGKWVWVNHGDVTKLDGTVANKISTRYLHLDTIDPSLTVGQQITQGTIIGTVGGTGGSINYVPHLHFEIRQGDIPLDLGYQKTIPLDPLGFVTYPSPIFSVTALSPVDLSITDPEGMVVDKTRNDFGIAADYFEPKYKGIPIDGEGIDGYDMVSFDTKKDGDYLMRVIPEQGVLPEETFTLRANICGVSTTLSENTLVSNIPNSPYILRFTGCSFERFIPTKIVIPTLHTEYVLGSQIQIQFSAVNNIFGTASISAKLNGVEVLNGQNIILTKPGNNILEVTAIDNSGYATTLTKVFTVTYNFGGFLPPIKIDGSGVYNLGRTLPVKFRLSDINGNSVPTALVHLYAAKINDGILGTDEVPLSTSSADTGNQFRYDLMSNQYVYNLSTDTLSAGSWQLKAVLGSGQTAIVIISVR